MLDKGIRVVHIWHLPEGDSSKAVGLARNLIRYVGRSGAYEPKVVGHDDRAKLGPPPAVVFVPGFAALFVVLPDTAAIITEQDDHLAVASLLAQTLQRNSHPAFKAFENTPDGLARFDKCLAQEEGELGGDRRLFKAGTPLVWIPPTIEEDFIERSGLLASQTNEEIINSVTRSLVAHTDRWEILRRELPTNKNRELVSLASLEEFAETLRPRRDAWWGNLVGDTRYEKEEAKQIFDTAIERLGNPLFEKTYEVGLFADNLDFPGLENAFWEVKHFANGGTAVAFVEIWASGSRERGPSLLVTEPGLVQGFEAWFDELWEAVPEDNRSRNTVRDELIRLRDRIK
jgi:hypothetical protein